MRGFNDSKLYDLFNNPFLVEGVRPDLNLRTISIDDSPCPNKIPRYSFVLLPSDINVTYVKCISKSTTHSEPPKDILLNSDDYNTKHTTMIDNLCHVRGKR